MLKQEGFMNKEQLEARIAEIKQAVEQSTANHNALLGRLMEAQYTLDKFNEQLPVEAAVDVE
jgi:predicted  nucleic acid-binding Zn-ribbon protein